MSAGNSPALFIGRHRQLWLCIGLSLRPNDSKLAGAILDGAILELVVLTFLVELDTGSHTDIVGNVSRTYGIG